MKTVELAECGMCTVCCYSTHLLAHVFQDVDADCGECKVKDVHCVLLIDSSACTLFCRMLIQTAERADYETCTACC
jgi:hypothetical protein